MTPDWTFLSEQDLDITNLELVLSYFNSNSFDLVINCAAYTAVDKAESEPELADAINHLAVAIFAQIAKENVIKLIHISTDNVFEGTNDKPYLETDTSNPKSVYG